MASEADEANEAATACPADAASVVDIRWTLLASLSSSLLASERDRIAP